MKEKKQRKKAPAFLKNLSGGAMCAMTDGARFGPIAGG
jgi:hypothetical protein